MSSILISGATIVTMNPRREILVGGEVLITENRIAAIGKVDPTIVPTDAERVDARGLTMMPGLVNSHVHTSQQLGRGVADDVDLLTWLRDRIWPFEAALLPEDQLISTLAIGAEMIRTGVTTFSEAGGQHIDAMGQAISTLGLRATICRSSMDAGVGLPDGWIRPTEAVMEQQLDEHQRWHGAKNGRIRHWFGLRTIFNCSDELILRTAEAAERLDTSIQIHVAEIPEENRFAEETRGATTVEHLAKLGVMGPRLLGVHCVWLTPREIALFAEHAMPAVHCPSANMRVLGFAPIPQLLAAGVPVGIGTDSPPCCNRGDIFDEIYLAALIHKGRHGDPTLMPAPSLLDMATLHGAACLRWSDEIGSLDVGKKADLVLLDLREIGTLPIHDLVSSLVYATHSRAVLSTMCDGRWLMRDRKLLVVDEVALLAEIQARGHAIRVRAGISLPERYPMLDFR
ncbi:amidohydrolase [soil metagenome]